MATISNDLELWRKEAEEQAKKHSDSLKQNNQYLIEQLNQQKQNTLEQLQKQQDNAIYNLNTNKSTINQTAEDNAKQANINRLLALKSNEQSLNRAGLGSQGIVGSQNASINNSYGQNLTSILNQKTSDLRELEKEKNDTLLKYNENRLNLSNEYDSNLANLQASIDDKALSQYNNIYNNYLAMKQQEYENEQNRLAQEEAIRQYNEQMAYQKQQDALAQANWEKEYALSKAATYNNNNNYSFDSKTEETFNENNNSKNQNDGLGNNSSTINKADYYFNGTDQPRYIGNTKLSNSGKTAGDLGVTSNGIGKGYRIWSANGKYYVWNSNAKTYLDVTDEYRSATNTKTTKGGGGKGALGSTGGGSR